jgi:DNA-binding IclR family transcriptional regulator
MKNGRYQIPNLERGLRVAEYLSTQPAGATLTEIVAALKIPKNSVFRITSTLLENGYVTRNENTMQFRLTKKFLVFGLAAVSDENLIENAMESLRNLRDATDCTAYLGAVYGAEGVILEQAPGGHPFKVSVDLGTRFLLHSGAPGKAMLAFLPEQEREDLMRQMKFTRFNERTITDRDKFRAELEKIRQCGYAVDRAEEFAGIHCVGAPVLDRSGRMVASIWISGQEVVLPESKFHKYGFIVKEHAMAISKRLGYVPGKETKMLENKG